MSANGSYEWCQQARVKSLQQCEDEREAKLAEADRNILAKNPYLRVTDGSYVGLLRFPVGMIVPPVVVYGVLFGLSRFGLWIINGFRA
jgi:hypothetical protein